MTLDDLRRAAELLPAGSSLTLSREAILAIEATAVTITTPATALTWRERLWTVPDDTRLSVEEVAEALGREKSAVYRAAAAGKGARRLPSTKLFGELSFTAADVRAWIKRESIAA